MEKLTPLIDAGASMELIRFCKEGNKIERFTERAGSVKGAINTTGSFYRCLQEGDISGAWRKADLENKRIMRDTFASWEIEAHAIKTGQEDCIYDL